MRTDYDFRKSALLVEVPRGVTTDRNTAVHTVTLTRTASRQIDEWICGDLHIHPLGSEAKNLKSGCNCRLFITEYTGSGSGMQNPLTKINWCFLLKSEMIGAPK